MSRAGGAGPIPRWAPIVAVAAGAALGAVAERAWSRRRLTESPVPDEPAIPHGTEVRRVIADDGQSLHVEIDTPVGWMPGNPTVVLVHGFALDLTTFDHQRRALREVARVVVYDHRGHGRSSLSSNDEGADTDALTIERLGADLATVIDSCAGEEMILIGHSMGGMTIMALAEAHPEWFGTSIRGTALLGTTAGAIATVTLGLPAPIARAAHGLTPLVGSVVERPWLSDLITRLRDSGSDVARILTRTYAFGDSAPTHGTDLVAHLLATTELAVVADLLADIGRHDRRAALDVIAQAPVLIMVGSVDRLTPAGHSRRMHKAMPGAELIVLDGVGHMLTLESPGPIDTALVDFVRSATVDQ